MSALLNNRDYQHGTTEKIGVLLINLGTPAAPTTAAVRAYLRQFLSDRRVIESPRWRWLPVLFSAVLPFRSPRTAAAYQSIWTADGSPLLVYSRAQRQKIAAALNDKTFTVELAMSYGAPSIDSALLKLHAQNCRQLLVLPLYPQYSSSTTGSVFVDVTRSVARWRAVPHFRFVAAYCDDSRYVEVLAESIAAYWQTNARPDKLIFFLSRHAAGHAGGGRPVLLLVPQNRAAGRRQIKLARGRVDGDFSIPLWAGGMAAPLYR